MGAGVVFTGTVLFAASTGEAVRQVNLREAVLRMGVVTDFFSQEELRRCWEFHRRRVVWWEFRGKETQLFEEIKNELV